MHSFIADAMLQAYLVLFQMELGVLRDLLRGLCKLRVALLLVPEAKQAKPQQSPNSSPDPEGLRAWSSSNPGPSFAKTLIGSRDCCVLLQRLLGEAP